MENKIMDSKSDQTIFEDMYCCLVTLDTFYKHKNFVLELCYVGDRKAMGQALPYEKLIIDYHLCNDNFKMYPVGAINAMFFLDEVKKLEAHLANFPGARFSYYKNELPIDNTLMARSWLPTGGGPGTIDLPDPDNVLGFSVTSCFDTRFCECESCVKRQNKLYDEDDFDEDGIHIDTDTIYNNQGFDRTGIHQDTGTKYNSAGYDKSGFNRNGMHSETCTAYDTYGYDCHGYDQNGWNDEHLHCSTGTEYNADGYCYDGYNIDGYNCRGINRSGFCQNGIHYETGTKFNTSGFDSLGFDKDGFDMWGYDKDGLDQFKNIRIYDENEIPF